MQDSPFIRCLLLALAIVGPAAALAEDAWDEFAVFMSGAGDSSSGSGASLDGASLSLDWPPRPSEVDRVAAPELSFDGRWRFRGGIPKKFEPADDLNLDDWAKVEVPGDFRMQGLDGGRVAYARSFDLPADWQGGRVKLRCHEIAAAADVWLNGHPVGRHVGHFIPFAFDLTDHVRHGQTNQIVIVAHKQSLARSMSGYSVHVGGGITRRIELIRLPSVHVSQLHATTDFDDRYEDATLQVVVEIANEGRQPVEDVGLSLALVDDKGRPAGFAPDDVSLGPLEPGKRLRRRIDVKVERPQSWNAEQPRLYRLGAALRTDGQVVEQVERRIGFREIEIRGRQLLVNGRPVKLRGVNRHLAHPLRGRSLTPELARRDAELLKAANCNFVRTSHYPPAEEFIAACDELGLYVEEEAPFCFFSQRGPGMAPNDVTRYAVYANMKMAQRDLSHPSVLVWSIGNESKWGPHFEAAARAVARIDPSRPRTFMWFNRQADCLNVAAEHYPGPGGVTRPDGRRPTLFSEYCHLPAYVPHESYTDPGVEDQWGPLLVKTWEDLHATPGATGGAIWCGIDDVFHVPPLEPDGEYVVRGVAAWGLLDGWRRPKPQYWHTKKAYSPVRLTVDTLDPKPQAATVRIPVANRYDFTNLDQLKISWQCGDARGRATADVPPQSRGEVVIDAVRLPAGTTLRLTFRDPTDRIVDDCALPVAPEAAAAPPKPSQVAWQLQQSADPMMVRRGQAVVQIDRQTGKIVAASVDDQCVLQGGPHLAFVPTFSKHQQRAMKGEPLRPTPVYGSQWQADSVKARQTGDTVEVRVEGNYREAALEGTYSFQPDGEIVVCYRLALNRNILGKDDVVEAARPVADSSQRTLLAFAGFRDEQTALVRGKRPDDPALPTPADTLAAVPRQLGLRFELPPSVDRLRWQRKAIWSVYPEDHIGRGHGEARAFVPNSDTREVLGRRPDWPWSQAASPLGTRDFRSTRHNILRASLTDARGCGVEVLSDGTQHSRCYLHDGCVHWLIADLDNGPSETFMSGYFDPKRQSVPLGKPLAGTVRLRLLTPK